MEEKKTYIIEITTISYFKVEAVTEAGARRLAEQYEWDLTSGKEDAEAIESHLVTTQSTKTFKK